MTDRLEIRWKTEADSTEEQAAFVSRCFLASPIFAGVDEERYRPEPIAQKLQSGTSFLAFVADRLVGSVTVFPRDPESPCQKFHDEPQVGLLAVDPEFGGRGIGSALLSSVEAALAGSAGLALSVTKRGAKLIDMYRARGYREVAEMHWPGAVDPSVIMSRPARRTNTVHERHPFTVEAATAALQPLVGLPLTDMWRPFAQSFEFGEQRPFLNRRGIPSEHADYRLTAYSHWRVTRGGDIVMGSDDHDRKRRFYDRKTPPREDAARRHWRLAKDLFGRFSSGELIVQSIEVDPTGSLRIELAQDYRIEILHLSAKERDIWRFFNEPESASFSAEPPYCYIFHAKGEETTDMLTPCSFPSST